MRKNPFFTLGLVLSLCFVLSAPALGTPFSAGLKIGTLGLGAEAGYSMNSLFKLRANANFLPLSALSSHIDLSHNPDKRLNPKDRMLKSLSGGFIQNADYDLDVKNALTAGLLLDFHPFMGGFRLTAGAYYYDWETRITGTPNGVIRIGDHSFSAADVGQEKIHVSKNKFAPYIGLGWGMDSGTGFGLSMDFSLGLLYAKLKSDYGVSGPVANPAHPMHSQYQRAVDQKMDDFNNISKLLRFHPEISLGLTFRF